MHKRYTCGKTKPDQTKPRKQLKALKYGHCRIRLAAEGFRDKTLNKASKHCEIYLVDEKNGGIKTRMAMACCGGKTEPA